MPSLPLDPVIQVNYSISPQSAARRGFNLGCIAGPSTVIPTSERVRLYGTDWATAMIEDGFQNTDPEYLAVEKYFSATSNPTQVLVGCIGSSETVLEGVQAIRAKNLEWYGLVIVGVGSDSDVLAVAAYIEAVQPYSAYIVTSSANAILSNTDGNLFAELHGLKYSRTMPCYSTNAYFGAAVLGYAMGQTSTLAGSYYTLFAKYFPGIAVDTLTTNQVSNVESNKGNVYINRGDFYDMFEKSTMADGSFFDQLIFGDMLVNQIQLNEMDLLYQLPSVTQTEYGMQQIRHAAEDACEVLKRIGFIAPGQWNGPQVLSLQTGQYLGQGYLVLSDSILTQPQSDRDARKAPAIYVCIKLAGSVHSMVIKVNVNR